MQCKRTQSRGYNQKRLLYKYKYKKYKNYKNYNNYKNLAGKMSYEEDEEDEDEEVEGFVIAEPGEIY